MSVIDAIIAKKLCGGGSSGGGSGFEYDFIIKTTDGYTFTLETGSYNAITAKVGTQPVKGKVILDNPAQKKDMDCVLVTYTGSDLIAFAYMGETYLSLIINTDNTVTLA